MDNLSVSHQQLLRPRGRHSHAQTIFALRQTLGSGPCFIREMHYVAISGKHILPCTYPLIAIAQRQDRWLYIWSCRTFSISKVFWVSGYVSQGHSTQGRQPERSKVRFEFINSLLNRKHIDATNGDWKLQKEDFVVPSSAFSRLPHSLSHYINRLGFSMIINIQEFHSVFD